MLLPHFMFRRHLSFLILLSRFFFRLNHSSSLYILSCGVFTMSRTVNYSCLRQLIRSSYRPRPVSCVPSQRRSASTTNAAAQSTASFSLPPQRLPLSWPEYLSLRRQRRLWSTFTTIPTTFGGLFAGGSYFAGLEADPTQLIMGVEPM